MENAVKYFRYRLMYVCILIVLALFGGFACARGSFSAQTPASASAATAAPTSTPSPSPTPTPTPSPTPTSTPSPTPTPTPTPSPTLGPPEGYTLAFSEEFDGSVIDENVWNFETGPWPYNKELEYYSRENAALDDGCLVIEARREEMKNRHYTSARLNTQGKLDLQYGYLEIRAALPTGVGTWSAIWLLPSDLRYGGYLHSGEIDIAERVGYDAKLVHASLHTFANNAVKDNAITAFSRIARRDDDFHIYALLWTEDELSVLMDGHLVLAYPREADATYKTWPFDVPFHLILNLAVGGTWGGAEGIDDEAFPQRMYIDYVRYYRKAEAPAE